MRTGNYELSQALPESNFRSFHARHLITGRAVLVHFLSQGGKSLTEVVAGLNAEARALLLDAGEQEGAAYLVTVPIEGFTTLEAWLTTSGEARGTAPGVPAAAAVPESDGEFTQFFAGAMAAPPVAKAPDTQPVAKAPGARADEDASFTQVFQPEKAMPVSKAPVAKAPVPKAPDVKLSTPAGIPGWGATASDGSFTEFFKSGAAEPAPVPSAGEPKPAPWPAEGRSNDFTEFFQGRDAPSPAPARAVPTMPSTNRPPVTGRPPVASVDPVGSATEFFHGPLPLPGGPASAPMFPASGGSSNFTSIVGGRGTGFPAPPRANPLPAPPGEWPPFSPVLPPAPSLPTLPPAPVLPTLPPPPAVVLDGSNRKMVLVGLLSFVIMVGFMAIVYLLVRK